LHEILQQLSPGSLVLDLGSGSGSFDGSGLALTVVRADLDEPRSRPSNFVACSASALPFADRAFQAVISNHSFEHFEDLDQCISEVARVLDPRGFLYIAVPDASTLTDRLYRWLGRGGGHINAFSDVGALPRMITAATGLRNSTTRVLFTSLAFLNRRNRVSRAPRKLLLIGGGHESVLRFATIILKYLDRTFHWRTSIYGWAYYFGELRGVDCASRSNVCVKCGSGAASAWLEATGRVKRRRFRAPIYACPVCETVNFFTEDQYWQSVQ